MTQLPYDNNRIVRFKLEERKMFGCQVSVTEYVQKADVFTVVSGIAVAAYTVDNLLEKGYFDFNTGEPLDNHFDIVTILAVFRNEKIDDKRIVDITLECIRSARNKYSNN